MPPREPAEPASVTVAYSDDILDRVAADLVQRHRDRLPDLSDLCILLPDPGLAGRFRDRLLDHLPSGRTAVLSPWAGTLAQWVNANVPLANPSTGVISHQARRLLFIEALNQNPGLFRDENKWQVTDALLTLFDELMLNDAGVLDAVPAQWRERIRQAYACDSDIDQLDREATIVYTLWQAWRRQLDANDIIDETGAYALRLRDAHRFIDHAKFFYAVHLENAALLEQALLERISAQGRCVTVAFDAQQPSDQGEQAEAMRQFTAASLDHDGPALRQRAETFRARQGDTPLPLSMYFCGDAEHEARAVELQIRRWLLAGRTRIGIISEDRKLSRRVRALLERANVNLRDFAGWSLATTSSASVIERWLECIEEDFDYRPMLDVLKSPAFASGADRESHLLDVYRLEHDIIQQENIAHGIARYRKQLNDRSRRLHEWPRESYQQVHDLLDRLESAAHYLVQIFRSRYPVPAGECMQALLDSLERLGLIEGLERDAAGNQILDALREMQLALAAAAPPMTWRDLRTWIGTSLEESLFNPADEPSPVWLMSLAQADGHRFDAVVLAAADRQHLPGKPASSPFFNQQVRRSLKLHDWNRHKRFRLQQFQRVVQSAPEVLITCKHEENGEPIPLSPWVEALDVFYRLTHDDGPDNPGLPSLLALDTEVFLCDTDTLPAKPEQPAPAMQAALLPKKISAGAHQRLIDCPYRFFAGDALKLKAPEAIIEELQKSDYGHRVHAILQAFHSETPGMPAPFTEAITAASRDRAIAHLEDLSLQVFRKDLEDNSLHRSWLFRWQQRIPEYIDWQITQQGWSPVQTEVTREVELAHGLRLRGRIDRIDAGGDGQRIIDYKTGGAPAQDEVDSGEDVQLVTYSMLHTDATSVAYLQLDPAGRKVSIRSQLDNDALLDLRESAKQRLETLIGMQLEGSPMPAWGDSATCAYCEYIGLCRRKVWDNTRN